MWAVNIPWNGAGPRNSTLEKSLESVSVYIQVCVYGHKYTSCHCDLRLRDTVRASRYNFWRQFFRTW